MIIPDWLFQAFIGLTALWALVALWRAGRGRAAGLLRFVVLAVASLNISWSAAQLGYIDGPAWLLDSTPLALVQVLFHAVIVPVSLVLWVVGSLLGLVFGRRTAATTADTPPASAEQALE
ncbi:MAG: hypothetical protein AAFR38_12510 [Planctomycetota bacterium]